VARLYHSITGTVSNLTHSKGAAISTITEPAVRYLAANASSSRCLTSGLAMLASIEVRSKP
jgi:hypothetical protein